MNKSYKNEEIKELRRALGLSTSNIGLGTIITIIIVIIVAIFAIIDLSKSIIDVLNTMLTTTISNLVNALTTNNFAGITFTLACVSMIAIVALTLFIKKHNHI